jgi:hypothetical protein
MQAPANSNQNKQVHIKGMQTIQVERQHCRETKVKKAYRKE